MRTAVSTWSALTMSGGDSRTLDLPGLEHQQPSLEAGPLDAVRALRRVELDADHQAPAAHVGDDVGEPVAQAASGTHRPLALDRGVVDQATLQQVDGREGRCARDGLPP